MFGRDERSERNRSEALSSRLREHAAHLAAAEYRWLRDLAEFDEIRGWAREGCRSLVQWLSWACGMGSVAARERLRVARALPGLPLVSEAFAAGELTYSKVRAITRVATPETEELLVGFARNATASQLERIVRGVRRSAQLDAKAHEAFQRRYVRWYYDDDGSVVIKARLDPTDGATVIEALERVAETLGEDDVPADDDVPARRGLGALPEIVAYNDDSGAIWRARYADALRIMAETTLEHGPGPVREPPHLVVHLDTDAHLDDGTAIAFETARRLACDSKTWTVLERDGVPSAVGPRTRTIPAALRRALDSRDEGRCRFPGCTNRRFVHAHHIRHFADGGPTTLDNLVVLCSFHHRLLHEGGYSMRAGPPGTFEFFRPDGELIPEVPEPAGGRAQAILETTAGLGIDATTAMPATYTARANIGDAVWGYFQRASR